MRGRRALIAAWLGAALLAAPATAAAQRPASAALHADWARAAAPRTAGEVRAAPRRAARAGVGALIGAAVGGVVGYAWVAASCAACDDPLPMYAGAGLGAATGAAVGAVIGAATARRVAGAGRRARCRTMCWSRPSDRRSG